MGPKSLVQIGSVTAEILLQKIRLQKFDQDWVSNSWYYICWYRQKLPGHMLPGQMLAWQLGSVKEGSRNLPLMFGQMLPENVIMTIVIYYRCSQEPTLKIFIKIGSVNSEIFLTLSFCRWWWVCSVIFVSNPTKIMSGLSNSWYNADIDEHCHDICWLDKCWHDS